MGAAPGVSIGHEAVLGVARLVDGHGPVQLDAAGEVQPVANVGIDVAEIRPVGLEGNARIAAPGTEQVVKGLAVMDHDVVAVGVVVVEILRHRQALGGGLVGRPVVLDPGTVLLANVPVQGQVVAEAGHQFAVVQLALGPKLTAVQ